MASGLYQWETFFRALDNWGLSDVLLPFLLIFTVVFAILQKTHVLGEKKNYNVIISLVLGFITVIPHATGRYPLNYDPILILQEALPSVTIVVVAVIMLLVLVGVWGAESDWVAGNTITGGIVIVSALVIVYIFGSAANWWKGWSWLEWLFGSDTMAVVVMILVFALVIFFVTGDEKQTQGDGIMKQVGELFRKK